MLNAIHNSQTLEMPQLSTESELCSIRTCDHAAKAVTELQPHAVIQSWVSGTMLKGKQDRKENMQCYSIYIQFKNKQNSNVEFRGQKCKQQRGKCYHKDPDPEDFLSGRKGTQRTSGVLSNSFLTHIFNRCLLCTYTFFSFSFKYQWRSTLISSAPGFWKLCL